MEHKEFTVLALEASWGAGRMVDRYVKGGPGTAEEAVADLRFWTWNTPEMLDLIKWMRAYNTRPGKYQSLTFVGFDMQDPAGPANYLAFALAYGGASNLTTEPTLGCVFSLDPSNPKKDAAKACRERVASLEPQVSNIADLNTRNIAQSALSNLLEYIDGSSVNDEDDVRDPAMAKNIAWMASNQLVNQKIALWAHNIHLDESKIEGATSLPMGYYLRKRFGTSYYSIGQTFGSGAVRALTPINGLQAVRIPRRPDDSISAIFLPLRSAAFLDLRSLPRSSALAQYFHQDHRFEEIGAEVDPANTSHWWMSMVLSRMYDGIVFSPTSSASVKGVSAPNLRRPLQIGNEQWVVVGPSLEDVSTSHTDNSIIVENRDVTDSASFGLYRMFEAKEFAGHTIRLTGDISRIHGLGYTAGVVEAKETKERALRVVSSVLPVTNHYGTWIHFSETIPLPRETRYVQGGVSTAGKGAVEIRNLAIDVLPPKAP